MTREFHLENQYLTDDDHMYHLGLLTSDEVIQRMHDVKVSWLQIYLCVYVHSAEKCVIFGITAVIKVGTVTWWYNNLNFGF